MKKIILAALFNLTLVLTLSAQKNTIFPKGEIGKNTNNYTGTIWLSELTEPDSALQISLAQASFAPASKLDWHIHPGGQYLLITDGVGYYQERGKPIQIVKKGEVIKSSPGVEHWHGSTRDSYFTYVGVTPTQKGKTKWLDKVNEATYQDIKIEKTKINANQLTDQEAILALSKTKWQWMADKNVEALNELFDEQAMFVHMGGTWGKKQEINVIKTGSIWYKKAEIYSASVKIIGNTAILLNDIDLEAVVGNNSVTNAFMVTEVYVKENNTWKMGSLTFSKLLRPVKLDAKK